MPKSSLGRLPSEDADPLLVSLFLALASYAFIIQFCSSVALVYGAQTASPEVGLNPSEDGDTWQPSSRENALHP